MRMSRKGALYSCRGEMCLVGDLPTGTSLITRAGEKFTIIDHNHTGYPENSTTLWSEVSTGTTYKVASDRYTVKNAAESMTFSPSLTNIMLDTTLYYWYDWEEEASYVAKQFAIGYKEAKSASVTGFKSQNLFSYLKTQANRIRYHNGAAVKHATRDLSYGLDDGENECTGAIYVASDGDVHSNEGSISDLYVFPALNIPNTTKITGKNADGYYILSV